MNRQRLQDFHTILVRFYGDHGRHDMLWRQPESDGSFDPYKILVSELMLQQTQVVRVTPKYAAFLEVFPSVQALGAAQLSEVLRLWSGLGYNRRAKFLWQSAQAVVRDYDGVFPTDSAGLQQLPGVGPNTAGAIMAYAFNAPVVYVETNVRTVIIHHFFPDQEGIADVEIREILSELLEQQGAEGDDSLPPREFYWAIMDYGAHLKKTVGNLNRASKSFAKQSPFHGSRRQLRGAVIRLLSESPCSRQELLTTLDDERTGAVIDDLLAEKLIRLEGLTIRLG
jgi:A/G-specific adenine glycosylase